MGSGGMTREGTPNDKRPRHFCPSPFRLRLISSLVAHDFFFGLGCFRGFGLESRSDGDGPERNESTFRNLLFQDVLAIELFHARVLGFSLDFLVAGAELLFTGSLG